MCICSSVCVCMIVCFQICLSDTVLFRCCSILVQRRRATPHPTAHPLYTSYLHLSVPCSKLTFHLMQNSIKEMQHICQWAIYYQFTPSLCFCHAFKGAMTMIDDDDDVCMLCYTHGINGHSVASGAHSHQDHFD